MRHRWVRNLRKTERGSRANQSGSSPQEEEKLYQLLKSLDLFQIYCVSTMRQHIGLSMVTEIFEFRFPLSRTRLDRMAKKKKFSRCTVPMLTKSQPSVRSSLNLQDVKRKHRDSLAMGKISTWLGSRHSDHYHSS